VFSSYLQSTHSTGAAWLAASDRYSPAHSSNCPTPTRQDEIAILDAHDANPTQVFPLKRLHASGEQSIGSSCVSKKSWLQQNDHTLKTLKREKT
jgi:hypothetical protein